MRGTLLRVSALLALWLLWAQPVLAQYPQDTATAGASDLSVRAGQRLTVGGAGWAPRSKVRVAWWDSSRDSFRRPHRFAVRRSGLFSTEVRVPPGIPPGEHFIKVSGRSIGGGPTEIGIRMLVSEEKSVAAAPRPHFSGANLTAWALIAVVLLLVGVGALQQGRRGASLEH